MNVGGKRWEFDDTDIDKKTGNVIPVAPASIEENGYKVFAIPITLTKGCSIEIYIYDSQVSTGNQTNYYEFTENGLEELTDKYIQEHQDAGDHIIFIPIEIVDLDKKA